MLWIRLQLSMLGSINFTNVLMTEAPRNPNFVEIGIVSKAGHLKISHKNRRKNEQTQSLLAFNSINSISPFLICVRVCVNTFAWDIRWFAVIGSHNNSAHKLLCAEGASGIETHTFDQSAYFCSTTSND